jgi:phage shock protein A
MGQLLRRIQRLVKSELNYSTSKITTDQSDDAVALAVLGGVAGASLGKVGILAQGTGFSVGAFPLAATGALTGFALYEAIRLITQGDNSSIGAAAIGGAVGGGISAAIGGVGVAAGGTAFAVGMAPMVTAGSIVGLGIAGLTRLLQQGVDPEKLLDLAIEDMQQQLVKLRQAVIPVMVTQKQTLRQYEQAQSEVSKWQRRAKLAVQNDRDDLAREALRQKKTFTEKVNTLKAYLDEQTTLVDVLKSQLASFESKVSEAKVFKTQIQAQIIAAKTQEQLQEMELGMNTSNAMAAFEKLEAKVLMQESQCQSLVELADADLDSQFAALELSSEVDEELNALKAQLSL